MRKRGYSKSSTKWKGIWNFRYLLIFIFLIGLVFVVFALPTITIVSPTLANNSYTNNNWVFVNITSDEDLNQSLLEWGNASGFTNVSMDNSSLTNWYKNMTSLDDYAYNYTIWAQNTTGNWNQSTRYFVTVDTIVPAINFTSPTPDNAATRSENYVYVNVTTNDTNEHSAFIDWNYSLVGWWSFENVLSNGTVYDNSTYGNDGVMNNFASNTTVTGKRGKALEFDGVDDYVGVNDDDSIGNSGMSELTFAMWIYPKDDSQIMGIGGTTDDWTSDGYNFYLRGGYTDAEYAFNIDNVGQARGGDIVVDQWHHIVGTYNGSLMILYLDTEEIATSVL